MACITFLSDYGTKDGFVGIVHSTLHRLAPNALVIDLSHEITPFNVIEGARLLQRSIPWISEGVVLAVVDPGVGSSRRAIALKTYRRPELILVGPDNGLLWDAAAACGGIQEAVTIDRKFLPTQFAPKDFGHTFDGRDVFAPAAAKVFDSGQLGVLGERADIGSILRITKESSRHDSESTSTWETEITWVDIFGNVQLAIATETLAPCASVFLETGTHNRRPLPHIALRWVTSFYELAAGQFGLMVDSFGAVAIVMNGSAASNKLGLKAGDTVRLSSA